MPEQIFAGLPRQYRPGVATKPLTGIGDFLSGEIRSNNPAILQGSWPPAA